MTGFSNYSAGDKTEKTPNTFMEVMSLPEKEHWKAALDKEMARLETNNVYTLSPATSVPTWKRGD